MHSAAILHAGPGAQAMAGGDLVGQLPVAMPKTITATDQLLRSGCPPEARYRALELLLALAAVECQAGTGDAARMLPGLLRDLVIVTRRLVGRTWLDANAEETASFTMLQTSLHAPPLPELDHLLACLLADRFGLSAPGRQPGPMPNHRRQIAAGADRRGRPAGPGQPRQPAELREPRPGIADDARRFSAAAALDGRDESGTAEDAAAGPSDTAGCASGSATPAAAPTWISLLRKVNLGMQRELRSGGWRRSVS
jgi:hypothetical protein